MFCQQGEPLEQVDRKEWRTKLPTWLKADLCYRQLSRLQHEVVHELKEEPKPWRHEMWFDCVIPCQLGSCDTLSCPKSSHRDGGTAQLVLTHSVGFVPDILLVWGGLRSSLRRNGEKEGCLSMFIYSKMKEQLVQTSFKKNLDEGFWLMKDGNFLSVLVLLLPTVQGIALMENVRRVLTAIDPVRTGQKKSKSLKSSQSAAITQPKGLKSWSEAHGLTLPWCGGQPFRHGTETL